VKLLGFPKEERLCRSSLIQAVFRKGKKYSCNGAKLFVLANGLELKRIVFTFPRGYGNAVERNYSRRLSKEAYRSIKQHIIGGFDFTFLIFPGKVSFSERKEQILYLFRKAGLWAEKK